MLVQKMTHCSNFSRIAVIPAAQAECVRVVLGLFGLVHLNPWQFVSAFALGLMFAWC
jgi:hypothetical protein